MTAPLVALNCIVHNGGESFRAMLQSAAPYVDEVVIGADPRSLEETTRIAHEEVPEGVTLKVLSIEWRGHFGWARNQVLDATEAPMVLWLDHDDTLVFKTPPGQAVDIRQALAVFSRRILAVGGWDALTVPYHYSYHPDGRVEVSHYRERLIRKAPHLRWKFRVHEGINVGAGDKVAAWATNDQFIVAHSARVREEDRTGRILPGLWCQLADYQPRNGFDENDPEPLYDPLEGLEDGERDLRVHELWTQTTEPRTIMYFGLQNWNDHNPIEGEVWFRRFLSWEDFAPGRKLHPVDKWQALLYLAKCCAIQNKTGQARDVYLQALGLFPQWPNAYLGLAAIALMEGDLDAAEHHALAALREVEGGARPHVGAFVEEAEYAAGPYALLQQIAYRRYENGDEGKLAEALDWCQRGLVSCPGEPGLTDYAAQYEQGLAVLRRNGAAITVAEDLMTQRDLVRAHTVLTTLPYTKSGDRLQELAASTQAKIEHLLDDTFYAEFHQQVGAVEPESVIAGERTLAVQYVVDRLQTKRPDILIDLGCGLGENHPHYAPYCGLIIGVDVSEDRLGYAKKLSEEHGYNFAGVVQRAEEFLPIAKKTFQTEGLRVTILMDGLIAQAQNPAALYALAEAVTPEIISLHHEQPLMDEDEMGKDASSSPNIRAVTYDNFYDLIVNKRPSREEWEQFSAVDPESGKAFLAAETRVGADKLNDNLCVIYCGPGYEAWTPLDFRIKGVGGAEMSTIRLAEEVVALGWKVIVYAMHDGVNNGVLYRHYTKFDSNSVQCTLFVSWRSTAPLDQILAWYGQRKPMSYLALWLHDILPQPVLAERHVAMVDRIWTMSQWQQDNVKAAYPFVPAEKFAMVYSGVDALDVQPLERQPHKLVWASWPTRGLEAVLDYWPEILKVWPDAELEIFYGWNGGPSEAADRERISAKVQQNGVTWRGRVPRRELRQAWTSAGFFLYPIIEGLPGYAVETFCASALEAQLGGAVVIAKAQGAITEIIGSSGALVPVEKATIKRLFEEAAFLDAHPERLEKYRRKGYDNAAKYTWARAAETVVGLAAKPALVTA